MWMNLSVSLLSLAVVMLFSASEAVDSQVRLPECRCKKVRGHYAIENIKLCYEQKRLGCANAFVIITRSDETFCVKPTPKWLKDLRNKGELECHPEFSKPWKRFNVLDEDDVEQ